MLIRSEVEIQLAVIIRAIIPFARLEEVTDIVRGESRLAKDTHDLKHGSAHLEVVLDDGNEAVGDDGDMYLNADGVLRLSPETLDLEVLLDPLEKKLHLPPIFIKEGNVLRAEIEVVRVVDEAAMQFLCVVYNPSKSAWVLFLILLLSKADALVFEHVVSTVKHALAIDNLVCWLPLLPEYEESAECVNRVETGKVEISSVKHIAGQRLVSEPVHGVDIMDLRIGDAVEHGNLRDDVDLRVNLDSRLCASELRPFEHGHTEVDGGRVDGIEPAVQFKISCNPLGLGNGHHVEGKLLKDAVVSEAIGLGKHLLIHRGMAKSKMFRFLTMGGCYVCKFPETPTAHQLTEHQYKHVTPVRKRPAFGPVVVLGDNAPKVPLREELNYLCEHESSYVHICSDLKTDAKVHTRSQVWAITPHIAQDKDSLTKTYLNLSRILTFISKPGHALPFVHRHFGRF